MLKVTLSIVAKATYKPLGPPKALQMQATVNKHPSPFGVRPFELRNHDLV
jgi:hypothetical protein